VLLDSPSELWIHSLKAGAHGRRQCRHVWLLSPVLISPVGTPADQIAFQRHGSWRKSTLRPAKNRTYAPGALFVELALGRPSPTMSATSAALAGWLSKDQALSYPQAYG
jgi:hypothetical protein